MLRVFALIAIGALALVLARPLWHPLRVALAGTRTVEDVVLELGPTVDPLWSARLLAAGLDSTPDALILIALKAERSIEIWSNDAGEPRHIHSYPILAASGGPGPKLREGDKQVPEGLYRIESLNANSRFHLSMKLDYPNAFDHDCAALDGRLEPGSDIFIHGGDRSIGCIAIGDDAIEELFVLIADVGYENVEVVIAPSDPRGGSALTLPEGAPLWTLQLYALITDELRRLDDG